jgi:hypothetical protein
VPSCAQISPSRYTRKKKKSNPVGAKVEPGGRRKRKVAGDARSFQEKAEERHQRNFTEMNRSQWKGGKND